MADIASLVAGAFCSCVCDVLPCSLVFGQVLDRVVVEIGDPVTEIVELGQRNIHNPIG